MAPGHSFQYRFRLPRNAPTGTFWYHSHEMVPMSADGAFSPDAASEEQVFDGLSGLLEVKGLSDDLPRAAARDPAALPGPARRPGGRRRRSSITDIDSNAPTTRLVDGQLRPRLTIAPGQTQLWHIGNVGADIFYRLALPGHTFEVVAQDGHPVIHARRVSTLLLPAGQALGCAGPRRAPGDDAPARRSSTTRATTTTR